MPVQDAGNRSRNSIRSLTTGPGRRSSVTGCAFRGLMAAASGAVGMGAAQVVGQHQAGSAGFDEG